ncbi:hypothetical protein GCM10009835_38360 [Planosporangium flavigriseum]
MNSERLLPTGNCWCGCGKQTGLGSFFAQGHDKIAEAALVAAEYGASVAQLLTAYGYAPHRGRPVIRAAVDAGHWEACGHDDGQNPPCWYCGTPESVRNHRRKYNHTSSSQA